MIISASKLLTFRKDMPPINNGAVVIDHGVIRAIGPTHSIRKRFPSRRSIALPDSVILPGLVNPHTHLELPLLLDAIRAGSFPEWVLNLIRAKAGLSVRQYAAAVRRNIETLIRTGTTTVGEICTHGVSPSSLKQSGLRAAIYHEIISMDPTAPFRRHSLPKPLFESRLLRNGLSPHSPYTVSPSALRTLMNFTRARYRRLSMHVAESKEEIRLLQGKKSRLEDLYRFAGWDAAWAPSAASPFVYLDRLGLLGPAFLAVHAVQATDNDIRLLRDTRTPVVHCPRSNRELGVGRMPLKKFIDAGITVGLGTDSLASVSSLSMWDEMRYAHRIHRQDGVSAQDLIRLATRGGAKALGMDKETGSLEPGKSADLIGVPLPSRNTGDLYSDLLRETNYCTMTMVTGKILHPR